MRSLFFFVEAGKVFCKNVDQNVLGYNLCGNTAVKVAFKSKKKIKLLMYKKF